MNWNNELIVWNKTFKSGIKAIDEQHKGLFELVNNMFSHVTGNEKEERKYFDIVIKKTVNHIKIHFAAEEKIMSFTKFNGYDKHKKLHDDFVTAITKNIHEFKSREHFCLFSFTKLLRDWLYSHITVMDKEYFEHFKKTTSQKPDGKLAIPHKDLRKIA